MLRITLHMQQHDSIVNRFLDLGLVDGRTISYCALHFSISSRFSFKLDRRLKLRIRSYRVAEPCNPHSPRVRKAPIKASSMSMGRGREGKKVPVIF